MKFPKRDWYTVTQLAEECSVESEELNKSYLVKRYVSVIKDYLDIGRLKLTRMYKIPGSDPGMIEEFKPARFKWEDDLTEEELKDLLSINSIDNPYSIRYAGEYITPTDAARFIKEYCMNDSEGRGKSQPDEHHERLTTGRTQEEKQPAPATRRLVKGLANIAKHVDLSLNTVKNYLGQDPDGYGQGVKSFEIIVMQDKKGENTKYSAFADDLDKWEPPAGKKKRVKK